MGGCEPSSLGAFVRRHRRALALSQEELADRAQLSVRTISDLERGVHVTARGRTIRRLGRALALEFDAAGLSRLMAVRAGVAPPSSTPGFPIPATLGRPETTPLVGRADVLAALRQRWVDARSRGGVVILQGEEGIGKSRLSRELARAVQSEGAVVLASSCDERVEAPFAPLVELVRQVVEVSSDTMAADLAHAAPDLFAPARAPGTHRPPGPAPADLADTFACLAEMAPLLVVLDDLQWADRPTMQVLRRVASGRGTPRLLVLGVYRDDDRAAAPFARNTLGELTRQRLVEPMTIGELSQREVTLFVETWCGGEARPDLVATIEAQTSGNPLLMEEVLRPLTGTSGFGDGNGHRSPAGVPPGARDLVTRWLARLPESVRQVLGVAAVCGIEFDLSTMHQVGPLRGAPLVDALDAAVCGRLLRESSEVSGRYSFRHGLVRDALYGAMSRSKRAWLHGRIGEAIEQRAEGDPVRSPSRLAHHFAEAVVDDAEEVREKAVDYSQRAGHEALRLGAPGDAARHFERALQVLESTSPLDELRCCDLLLALGQALTGALERDRARLAFRRAGGLARSCGSGERLLRAAAGAAHMATTAGGEQGGASLWLEPLTALEDGLIAERALLLGAVAADLLLSGSGTSALPLSHEALDLARRSGEWRALRMALSTRSLALWGTALVEERLGLGRELAERSTAAGDPDGLLDGLQLQGVPLLELGDLGAFDLLTNELSERGNRLGRRGAVAQAIQWRTMRALMEGRLDDARRSLAELEDAVGDVSDFAREIRLQRSALHRADGTDARLLDDIASLVDGHPGLSLGRAMLAAVHGDAGRRDEAQHALDQLAVRTLADNEADWNRVAVLALTAEACAALGALAPAALLYDLLRPHDGHLVVVASGTSCEGAVARHLGSLAGALGRWDDATGHFESALSLERSVGAWALVVRTQVSYAGVLVARHRPVDRSEARALLFAAERTADRLGLAGAAKQAEAVRAGLGA